MIHKAIGLVTHTHIQCILGWLQANTAHQLAEVYEALGNGGEASSMRQEVRAKVKDVREVVDETLAKAAAKSAQAHTKVNELKAQVLSHWQQAQRWGHSTPAVHDVTVVKRLCLHDSCMRSQPACSYISKCLLYLRNLITSA